MAGKRELKIENIVDIVNQLDTTRTEFYEKTDKVIYSTKIFATQVTRAIGEISFEEAKQGVINYFTEEMNKL